MKPHEQEARNIAAHGREWSLLRTDDLRALLRDLDEARAEESNTRHEAGKLLAEYVSKLSAAEADLARVTEERDRLGEHAAALEAAFTRYKEKQSNGALPEQRGYVESFCRSLERSVDPTIRVRDTQYATDALAACIRAVLKETP